MQPAVFRALLRFIYTDSLPAVDDLNKEDSLEMTRHLLVAADRYAMDRLNLVCAQILSKSLDVESVTTTLGLADRHNCSVLKDACIEFIISSNKMDDVAKTQGFACLKRSCPSVLVEVWEKAGKFGKI
jgi:speckle-type POZ protein